MIERKLKKQIIIGRNPVLEALSSGKQFERVFLKSGIKGTFEEQVKRICDSKQIPLKRVPQIKLDKLSHNKNHQGIIGFSSLIEYQDIRNVVPFLFEQGKTPLLLLLDGITDVRNLGAIARSAEVLGCHAIIVPLSNSAEINEDTIKSSAGALLHLVICREYDLQNAVDYLKECGFHIISSALKSGLDIFSIDLSVPLAIVVGSEQKGVSTVLLDKSDYVFSISQSGQIDSLNVSVATGIILYECQKQRSNVK